MTTSGRSEDPLAAAARRALQVALDQAAREAGAARAELQVATARFGWVSQEVIGVVGGSAQGVDRQMVTALGQASRHAEDAIVALGAAALASRGTI